MRKNRSNSNSPSANIWGLAIALKEFEEATEGGVLIPILPDRPSICWIRVVISQTGLGVRSPHSSRICYWRSHCWKSVLILQARRVRTRWALNFHFNYFWNSTSICPGGLWRTELIGTIFAWFERPKAITPSGLWTSIWMSSW